MSIGEKEQFFNNERHIGSMIAWRDMPSTDKHFHTVAVMSEEEVNLLIKRIFGDNSELDIDICPACYAKEIEPLKKQGIELRFYKVDFGLYTVHRLVER